MPHKYNMHSFKSDKCGGHSPHAYYSVIKRLSKQYVELFLVGVVALCYKKRGRFSCDWTGDQQVVSECVQHIDVHVNTHKTKTRPSSPVAVLAHHTQTVLSYSGTSWIEIRVSADWYLLFWESLHIQWDETQLHHYTERVWGLFPTMHSWKYDFATWSHAFWSVLYSLWLTVFFSGCKHSSFVTVDAVVTDMPVCCASWTSYFMGAVSNSAEILYSFP